MTRSASTGRFSAPQSMACAGWSAGGVVSMTTHVTATTPTVSTAPSAAITHTNWRRRGDGRGRGGTGGGPGATAANGTQPAEPDAHPELVGTAPDSPQDHLHDDPDARRVPADLTNTHGANLMILMRRVSKLE
jgi:hypothetical protein